MIIISQQLYLNMSWVFEKITYLSESLKINGYIARIALQQGRRPEKMREEMLRDGSLANFTLQVRESKCLEKLIEEADITEVEPDKAESKKKDAPKKKAVSAGRKKISEIRKKQAPKKKVADSK